MTDAIIGIDAGSSSVKVVAYAINGETLCKSQQPVEVLVPKAGWAELDLPAYWDATARALREVTSRVHSVLGIGLSTTAPTTILFDEALGPLRPGITYLDNRAHRELESVEESLPKDQDYFDLVGNRLGLSTCAAANVQWVRRKEPEIWNAVHRIGFLNSYLSARFTGQALIDWTHASYSGLYSLHERPTQWSDALLGAHEIDRDLLFDIQPPYRAAGYVTDSAARETGLSDGIPVANGSADTAAAAFGLGVIYGQDAFESVGTSGVLSFVLDEPLFDPVFLNRRHVLGDRWLAHGAMSMSGGSVDWARRNVWPELTDLTSFEELAQESVPGANGTIFLPYLSGERSPIWDSDANGAWLGLTRSTSRADMARAVFEAGAYAMRQIMVRARERWNWTANVLLGVGGGAKSSLWNQIKADVLRLSYQPAVAGDAAAYGAALLGGIAAGIFEGPEDPRIVHPAGGAGVIHPQGPHVCTVYDAMFEIYNAAYEPLSETMHGLANEKRNTDM